MKTSEYQANKVLFENENKEIVLIEDESGQHVRKSYYNHSNDEVYAKLMDNPHKHVVGIFKIVHWYDYFTVHEEYLGKITLEDLAPVSNRELFFDIVIEVCEAIKHIHSLGIVHRDIKPSNIYFTKGHVVVNDLDISKEINRDQSITQDTELLGSQGYASPEQYGFSTSDERSDIYSIGVLINYLLHGTTTIKSTNEHNMRNIINVCTKLDPADRYQTVDELLIAINQVRYGKGKYTLPGFRTNNKRNKIISVFGYIMMILFILFYEVGKSYTYRDLLQNKSTLIILSVSCIAVTTNYMNIKRFTPQKLVGKKYIGSIVLVSLMTLLFGFIAFLTIDIILNAMSIPTKYIS